MCCLITSLILIFNILLIPLCRKTSREARRDFIKAKLLQPIEEDFRGWPWIVGILSTCLRWHLPISWTLRPLRRFQRLFSSWCRDPFVKRKKSMSLDIWSVDKRWQIRLWQLQVLFQVDCRKLFLLFCILTHVIIDLCSLLTFSFSSCYF